MLLFRDQIMNDLECEIVIPKGMMSMAYLTILIAAALALATTLFALQNSTPVVVNLFLWTMESSLVVVIIGTATLGFVTAVFIGLFIQIKLQYRLYKADKLVSQLETEIEKLKLSLKESSPSKEIVQQELLEKSE